MVYTSHCLGPKHGGGVYIYIYIWGADMRAGEAVNIANTFISIDRIWVGSSFNAMEAGILGLQGGWKNMIFGPHPAKKYNTIWGQRNAIQYNIEFVEALPLVRKAQSV